jgi:hypothetical protein
VTPFASFCTVVDLMVTVQGARGPGSGKPILVLNRTVPVPI